MDEVFVRNPYNYDRRLASLAVAITCPGPSRTVQSSKEECDINTIVRRFGLTGKLPEGVRAPTYGDFTEVVDFQTAMNAVRLAGESFAQMPAQVRARFNNDPQAFVEFCSDEKNLPEMRELGLAVPKDEPAPEAAPAPTSGAA